ncbi:TPA: phage protein NinX family protein [Serratia fonticola]
MVINTKDLTGKHLDWAVAKALDIDMFINPFNEVMKKQPEGIGPVRFEPSTNWGQCGPFIEQFEISLQPPTTRHVNYGDGKGGWEKIEHWTATVPVQHANQHNQKLLADLAIPNIGRATGPTSLIAICRAIVDAKLGDIVTTPYDLNYAGSKKS